MESAMATGITAHEQHSEDALTAHLPHRDPNPLPRGTSLPILSYDHRASEGNILAPIPVAFVERTSRGWVEGSIGSNALVLCDNLVALNALARTGQKATLIYLDPPYNTGLDFHSRALQHAYKDDRSTAAYVEFMRRRLILARDCLADNGSIYVHIGHQMVGHLKVVMDEVFGPRNFRNIISRKKCSSKNFTTKQYSNLHDFLLFYSRSADYVWNQPGEKASEEWIDREYPKFDRRGRYKLVPVHAPGTRRGETGLPWRGVEPPPGKHWQYAPSKLEALDQDGFIHWSKTGNPRRKVYLTDDKMVPYTDHWSGFRDAHHQSIGITGYPTEKNLDMLRMIVGASSNPGDLVVDPFCGSGTALHAANDLGRRWVGMDESFVAVAAARDRLRNGLKAMGDYVTKKPTHDPQAVLVDLFAGEAPLRVTASPVSDFRLLVDEELLGRFRAEIDRLVTE
jgi:adenine-specific DNA-methyltransferase